jgi:hypothetical protein
MLLAFGFWLFGFLAFWLFGFLAFWLFGFLAFWLLAFALAFDLDLDLLLIFRPFGRPSVGVHQGVRRVAPCGEAAHNERRSSRSRP